MVIVFAVLFCVGSLLGGDALADKERDLKFVHVICRHGTRTPADTYPNDPHINQTFSPYGWGALTNKGKQDMYGAGLFLRERYNDFLGDKYSSKEFYVQTTDSDRTKMTAELINAGIWPPKGEQKWGKLDWQPIPVNYESLSQDSLLLVRKPCPRYYEQLELIQKSGPVKEMLDLNADLFVNLTQLIGMEVKDFEDAQNLYSTLKAEEVFGLELPAWTKDYYPEKLQSLTEFCFVLNAYDDTLKRLKGGVLLKKILADYYVKSGHSIVKRAADFHDYLIRRRREASATEQTDAFTLLNQWTKEVTPKMNKERKMTIYGGHDSTISNLLSALKVWEPQVPGYGITILLELSQDRKTQEYGLEIFLRNDTSVPPYQLTVPNCESFCPLSKLVKLVETVIPTKFETECKSEDPTFTQPPIGGP